jgi:hypothetical protein
VYWGAEVGQDAAGGYSNKGAVFDVARKTWSLTSASPVEGRYGAAAAGSNQLFFVWGGEQAPPTLSPEERATVTGQQATKPRLKGDGATYDVATATWHLLPAAPLMAGRQLGAAWNGQQFVVVGEHGCAAYDPATNRWQRLPNMPTPPTTASVVQVGDRTYVIGAYSYYLARGAAAWTPIPSLQNALVSTMIAATDEETLFAAALTGARPAPPEPPVIVDRFDPVTATWVPLPPSPARPSECSLPLAATGRNVYVACATSTMLDRATGLWTDYGVSRGWGGTAVGGNSPIAVGSSLVFAGNPTLIYSP